MDQDIILLNHVCIKQILHLKCLGFNLVFFQFPLVMYQHSIFVIYLLATCFYLGKF